ncbi:MAG: RsmE family RNA methyltransferase [Elusimicrobiota bacterium]
MQFLATSLNKKDGSFVVEGDEAFHIVRVLRKKPGDILRLFDGRGEILWGKITVAETGRIWGRLLESPPKNWSGERHYPFELHLYQALPKGQKWDWVLEKGCEIGFDLFVPLITSRVIAKLDPAQLALKQERWKRVLSAAVKQCGRAKAPELAPLMNFDQAVKALTRRQGVLTLFAWESELAPNAAKALGHLPSPPSSVAIFIGPEGGWSQEEVRLAQEAGFQMLSLGPYVLRTETAPLVAAGMAIALLVQ